MRGQLLIRMNAIYALVLGYSIFITLSPDLAEACGPGRGGSRRLMRRKYPPLVQRQYIPNVSENTLGASGRPEGAIRRRDKRFRELVQNRNPDIEFRDDEGTGADRMMSQRLKEKLSTLAISVMNQWPNVKLRVIEGWDEDDKHSLNSLHYEGRAVDITTNDKDKSKYGMLARLAVEAGFDWVHYESRSHVHCSVKSEKADSIRNNGCFDAASLVQTPNGQVQISQLQTNDLVLTMNSQTGQLQYSPFLMWLDRDDLAEELFVELTTKSNRIIRLTSSHLIYLADEPIDLTQPAPAAAAGQQLPLSPLSLVAAVGDDGSHHYNKNSNSINYYKYSVGDVDGANESGSNSDNKSTTNHSTTTLVPGNDGFGVEQQHQQPRQLPKITSSLPRGQRRPPTMEEVTYITYARNSLVGQYLLINDVDQQSTQMGDNEVDQQSPIVGQPLNKASMVRYKIAGIEDPTTRPPNRLIYDEQVLRSPNRPRPTVKFDQIVSVNFVTRSGRFAPLTREGNIVVNSVVASCYAVISDHDMAHLSFAPVRWFSYIQEWLLGMLPQPPPTSLARTLMRTRKTTNTPYIINAGDDTQRELSNLKKGSLEARIDQQMSSQASQPTIGVHWYPQLLYTIARYILPTRYLY